MTPSDERREILKRNILGLFDSKDTPHSITLQLIWVGLIPTHR